MKRFFNLLTACLLVVFTSVNLQAQDALPSVAISDLEGKKVNVSDFARDGKITVFSFWATWCSPCKKELNNLVDLYDEWRDEMDIEVVAVSIDDQRNVSKIKPYVNGQNWDYTVLLDTNQELMRALNIQNVPFTLVVDAEGNIVYKHSGYVEGDEYELEDKVYELAD